MPTHRRDLVKTLTNIPDEAQMEAFLKDILTPGELEDIASRLQIARLLIQGMPQRAIAKKLKVSLAKVTRGSREIKYGHKGFLNTLK